MLRKKMIPVYNVVHVIKSFNLWNFINILKVLRIPGCWYWSIKNSLEIFPGFIDQKEPFSAFSKPLSRRMCCNVQPSSAEVIWKISVLLHWLFLSQVSLSKQWLYDSEPIRVEQPDRAYHKRFGIPASRSISSVSQLQRSVQEIFNSSSEDTSLCKSGLFISGQETLTLTAL